MLHARRYGQGGETHPTSTGLFTHQSILRLVTRRSVAADHDAAFLAIIIILPVRLSQSYLPVPYPGYAARFNSKTIRIHELINSRIKKLSVYIISSCG